MRQGAALAVSRRVMLSCAALWACAALSACAPGTPAPASAGSRGEALFAANCSTCHQPDARGIPRVYPALAGSAIVNGDPGPLARWVVKGERPATMPAGRYPTAMPVFGWLKDADAAALLTHLRTHFGNHAAVVQPQEIARALGR